MIDVAVLGGGVSAEHQVSIRSATEVFRSIDRKRFRAWPVLVAATGAWHASDGPRDAEVAEPFSLASGAGLPPGRSLCDLLARGIAVVFPALHGRGGEDGTLQGMLDLHAVAYVGSGTAASAVAMDKIRTRECLTAHGVPMARATVGVAAPRQRDLEAEIARIESSIGFPCFMKLDLSGSSYGVRRCDDSVAARSFLSEERGRRYIAESLLRGEEISVPVLGNSGEALRALPPIGIYPLRDEYFDVRAKYEPGRTEELIPPRGLDEGAIEVAQKLAMRCHAAIGCDGVSRTDIIVTSDGPHVLEINTIPGMTATSLLPKCAAAAGIDFRSLLSILIDAALRRADEGGG